MRFRVKAKLHTGETGRIYLCDEKPLFLRGFSERDNTFVMLNDFCHFDRKSFNESVSV